jgi:hypothetical protein
MAFILLNFACVEPKDLEVVARNLDDWIIGRGVVVATVAKERDAMRGDPLDRRGVPMKALRTDMELVT